jgi:hypothetical protein
MKHLQKILILLFFVLHLCFAVQGQTVSLQWRAPEKITYQLKGNSGTQTITRLRLVGATYPLSPYIPSYHKTIQTDKTIKIGNYKWTDLSPTEEYILKNYGPEISDILQWDLYTGKAAKVKQTHLTIFPFRKDPKTGKLQKLVSFTISSSTQKQDTPMSSLSLSNLNEEPLAHGNWWKIKIPETGIYRISYEKLIENGIENPEDVALYSHFSGQLPIGNMPVNDSLSQLAIYFDKGNDNVFNDGDYLMFYARGAEFWKYNATSEMIERYKHLYAETNYVFITDNGSTSSIATQSAPDTYNHIENMYLQPFIEETDKINLLESGQLWLGDQFDARNTKEYTFGGENLVSQAETKITLSVAARASSQSAFTITDKNNWERTIQLGGVNLSSQTGIYATQKSVNFNYTFDNADELTFRLNYNQPNASATGWLDYLLINIPTYLRYEENPLEWINNNQGEDAIKWEITTNSNNLKVWGVTNHYQPTEMSLQYQHDKASFIHAGSNTPQYFCAFTPEDASEVEWVGKIDNQSIRKTNTVEMLIITHPLFVNQAKRLAHAHETLNALSTKVVTTQAIYNAYTAGKPDAAALRNFIRDCYHQPNQPLKYVLLFGDGSYNNKAINQENTNFIPTYQSRESLITTQSFVSDDFYGLLDPDENIENYPSGLLDIGIGRFPVTQPEEASLVVDKSIQYMLPEQRDSWQQRICFVGDDEDNNIHMRDADRLASFVDTTQPYIEIKKLYLDAFNQESSLVNESYPEVNRQISEQINNGILLFNYTGHGGETGLAHERIVTVDDINSWNNKERLTLFMTATCEFSRFDAYEMTSAGEQVLLNPNGGAVALLTTTRLVYSSPNYELNRKFYDHFFTMEQGSPLKLGEVFRRTKIESGTGNNKRNFTLLGDPALPIPIPGYKIVTDSINDFEINTFADTLQALSKVTLSGHIETPDGNFDNTYNGTLTATILDKAQDVYTLSNDGGTPFEFEARLSPIYKGKVTIKEGTFRFTFIIPKDIILTPGEGRILYFSKSDDAQFAKGATENIIIGGVATTQQSDNQGPNIELFMNDTIFRNGGITNATPRLLAKLEDENGINAIGNGIGHDITAWIDGDTQHPIVLNNYFTAEQDSYQKGTLEYQLPQLSPGIHELRLKAWDSFNNSNERSITFKVVENTSLTAGQVYNYPNPFSQETAFIFEHNLPNEELTVLIEIVDLTGRKITSFTRKIISSGFRSIPIVWNGSAGDGNKLNKGVYIYNLKITSESGKETTFSGKMIKAE